MSAADHVPIQLVTLTGEQLAALITDAIDTAMERYLDGARQPAAVLTADQLCEALQISRPTLRKLEAEQLPHIPTGDHRRYVLSDCLAHLRAQKAKAGDAG